MLLPDHGGDDEDDDDGGAKERVVIVTWGPAILKNHYHPLLCPYVRRLFGKWWKLDKVAERLPKKDKKDTSFLKVLENVASKKHKQ